MRSTKGESIDAHAGGGPSHSSVEASVMEVERRGWTSFARVIANWETRRSINFRSRFAVARRQGNGWDEPYKPRGLRTVLWAAGGEIPPADPAIGGRDGEFAEPAPCAASDSGVQAGMRPAREGTVVAFIIWGV